MLNPPGLSGEPNSPALHTIETESAKVSANMLSTLKPNNMVTIKRNIISIRFIP